MCGIAGIVGFGGPPIDSSELQAMVDAQAHRGPDHGAVWVGEDPTLGLGHRRLSIIDLSPAGRQPMHTEDDRLHVVSNGEIYNYAELRSELGAIGHRFRTSSDTEVLLHGYRQWGLDVLHRVRGMFAFALHDRATAQTLLARDPLGIKPLYYAERNDQLVFASEVQAIRRAIPDASIDARAVAAFLMWGSIAAPLTLYNGIRALPPGSWLRVGPTGIDGPHRYFALEQVLRAQIDCSPTEAAALAREALVDSVRAHMVADVEVGVFLSGGVDSAALTGLMSQLAQAPVRAVTLAVDDPALDESSIARQIAQRYGVRHEVVRIGTAEARARLPTAMRALDQPSVDGINTYLVAEAAVRAGLRVAVSGVGGDELFGGYSTFQALPRLRRAVGPVAGLPGGRPLLGGARWLADRLPVHRLTTKASLAAGSAGDRYGAYVAGRALFSQHQVRRLLGADARDAVDPPVEYLERVVDLDALPEAEYEGALEMRHYLQAQLLRDTDAMGMRHSLEIRTPLVDRTLLAEVARIPAALRFAGPAKRYLREAPAIPVPREAWDRPKRGFTLPFGEWMRRGAVDVSLPDHPLLDREATERVWRAFVAGRLHWSRAWALLVLGVFLGDDQPSLATPVSKRPAVGEAA